MTIFAGIYSFSEDKKIDEQDQQIILEALTHENVVVDSYSEPGFFLAKADIGAFQEPSFLNDSKKPIAALAGDPILRPPGNIGRSRFAVVQELASVLLSDGKSILQDCQGVYNLCWYNPKTRELLLVADKIGVRPLYYYQNDHYLYFSGNLGIFESLHSVSKCMDLVGVTEKTILGTFLGRRTPYLDIHVLRGGEYLESGTGECTVSQYFKWDDIPVSKASRSQLLEQAYESFNQAVASRAWREESVVGFLSGGMDSRALITSLWALGKKIFCGNLSFAGSQDAVYAEEYADILGVKYFSFKRNVDEKFKRNMFQHMMSDLIAQIIDKETKSPRLPRLVFSGEGGSVGLGHVYMNEDVVEKMRLGKIDEVISQLMKGKYIPRRLLKDNVIAHVLSSINEDLVNELKSIRGEDPGRNFFLFLLNNDQRCHMVEHFEDILFHRLELLAPFYDGKFLELIISVPVDECLYHKFYTKLFDLFPKEIKASPWQTYPGHVPCPVQDDRKLKYQWSSNEGNKKFYSKRLYDDCKNEVYSSGFPKKIFNRYYLLLSLLLHRLGVKNYSSEFRFFSTYHRYYSMCDGKIDL